MLVVFASEDGCPVVREIASVVVAFISEPRPLPVWRLKGRWPKEPFEKPLGVPPNRSRQ